MRLFRRKPKSNWPAELERRKPENAEHRRQLEVAHRARLAIKAQQAAEATQEVDPQITHLRNMARLLEMGHRKN